MRATSDYASEEFETRASRLVYLLGSEGDPYENICAQIRFFGYRTELFTDDKPFSEAVGNTPPSVAVIDIDRFSDIQVVLRAPFGDDKQEDFKIPLIFLSESDGMHTRLNAVRAGGKAFFQLPLDIANLIDVLDQIAWFAPPSPMRVLIVDDSLVHANFTALHLANRGMITKVLYDPTIILDVMEEFQPELVLLDMYMPYCTGMELAAVIRQIPGYVGIPIVYLSSETDRNRQLEAVSIGGDDFLEKPIKPEHLISAVSSRIERYRNLRELMLRDSLTGLYNHTTIKEHLRQEFARAQRSEYPLSCVVLDLDNFKDINDTYGHSIGDRVLKSLAQLLLRRLRQSDIVGRYGGEEFVLVLPETPVLKALNLVDELRENFSQIRHRGEGVEFCLTFSGGVAGWPPYSSPNLLFEMADRAMYAAKNRGRNQILVAK
jgi:diguanylate cyclase (GGDEF)-like protein